MLGLESDQTVYSLAGCAAALVGFTLQVDWFYSNTALSSVLLPMLLLLAVTLSKSNHFPPLVDTVVLHVPALLTL